MHHFAQYVGICFPFLFYFLNVVFAVCCSTQWWISKSFPICLPDSGSGSGSDSEQERPRSASNASASGSDSERERDDDDEEGQEAGKPSMNKVCVFPWPLKTAAVCVL